LKLAVGSWGLWKLTVGYIDCLKLTVGSWGWWKLTEVVWGLVEANSR
jgi:hypothetical protein